MNSDSETSLLMIVEFNGYKFYHNLSDHFPVVKHLDGFWFFSLFKLCCGEYPSTSFDFWLWTLLPPFIEVVIFF